MALKLYLHPLSSYCHKALLAFYENDIPFDPMTLDEATYAQQLKKVWPLGKFPVLVDETRGEVVPESTIIIEYLAQHYPGEVQLIPADPDEARRVRTQDRLIDLYMHASIQKLIGDRLRPADQRDPLGVEEARRTYHTALGILESRLADGPWIMGGQFTLADCAAAPTLFYGNMLYGSLDEGYPCTAAYLRRLMVRPAYAKILREAEPYLHLVPR